MGSSLSLEAPNDAHGRTSSKLQIKKILKQYLTISSPEINLGVAQVAT